MKCAGKQLPRATANQTTRADLCPGEAKAEVSREENGNESEEEAKQQRNTWGRKQHCPGEVSRWVEDTSE